jgi:hypothetical protein
MGRLKESDFLKKFNFFISFSDLLSSTHPSLPPFTFGTPFLVARVQSRGSQAGSAGVNDPMKDRFSSAEKGGKRKSICAPQVRFRPYR